MPGPGRWPPGTIWPRSAWTRWRWCSCWPTSRTGSGCSCPTRSWTRPRSPPSARSGRPSACWSVAVLTRCDDLVRQGAPERPAVTFKDDTLTYRQLAEQVAAAANGLRALGLERGDRVLVYLEKRLETVVALFAASAAGLVMVPVNPLLKAKQVGFIAGDCGARAVVTSAERRRTLRGELPTGVEHVVEVGGRGGAGEASDHEDAEATAIGWAELCASPEPAGQDPVPVVDADIAAILYTSGSTGTPKGVVLSHRNLLAGAESVAGYLVHTADDVVLSVLPLSFDAGLSQVTTALHAGAPGPRCAAGEEGESGRRGAVVALGCWNDPERPADRFGALPGGAGAARAETAVWSGDRAVRDEDGFLYFRGRADEMIKTSGYRVSPTEVEAAAHATGLVAEAAAFGVPDPALGQHIVLVAAAAPGSPADPAPLLAALREQLPVYMLPRRIEFRDRLPRSANGKFDRALLRERMSHPHSDRTDDRTGAESNLEMGLT